MAKYCVNNYTVENLLSSIKSKEIAIPEMQRPFVWDAAKVRDLMDSLYQGFPVGYLIVWQNPRVKLKDGTSAMGKKVLIDGQQRVTALTAGIVGQEVLDAHYKKQRIRIAFNPLDETFEVANPAIEHSDKWIPDIAEVFKNDFDVFRFVMDFCAKHGLPDADRSRIGNVINRLKSIQNNSLGVISLAEDLEIDSVTEIFIRINSKGAALSQADFAMSKIAANETYGGNVIRKTIDYFAHLLESPEDLQDIQKNDADFAARPEFQAVQWAAKKPAAIYKAAYSDILRVAFIHQFKRGRLADLVSLLSGRDFETREYKIEIEEKAFRELNEAVLRTVNQTNYERFLMIIQSAGLIREQNAQNFFNFGYALYLALREKGLPAAEIEHIVRRWLVLSLLTSRYSGSPESQFDKDIKAFCSAESPRAFLEMTEAGELSDAFWNISLVQKLDTSVQTSPFFQGYLAAQVKAHDKGFLSTHITVQDMIENRGDIHHLFPKKYLSKAGLPRGQYNQVANYVMLQQEINIDIGAKAPCEYMAKVLEQCETGKACYGGITDRAALEANLRENCIPEEFLTMTVDDYPAFLERRRVLMAQKMRRYYESL